MLGTLDELAARLGGRVVGNGSVRIARVSTVEEADGDALTFATNEAYFTAALASEAAAILVDDSFEYAPAAKPLLVVGNARHALALLLQSLRPLKPQGPFRHPSAVIEPDAQLAGDVYVGAHAYVGNRVAIGAGSVVGAGRLRRGRRIDRGVRLDSLARQRHVGHANRRSRRPARRMRYRQ